MKQILSMLAVAVMVGAMATGCTSISTSDGAESIDVPSVENPGYKATFDVKKERVSGEGQVNVLFGIFAWGADGFAEKSALSSFSFLPSPENFAKSAAVYNACQQHKVDSLLGTRYKVTSVDYFVFKKVKCEVAGYPATMTGVTELTPFILEKDQKLIYLDKKPAPLK